MIDTTTVSTKQQIDSMDPVAVPPEQQADIAALYQLLEQEAVDGHLRLVTPSGQTVIIPSSLVWVLEQIVQVMANGNAVSVIPVNQELTIQQAADILNVSPPYIMQLLEGEQIPFTYSRAEYQLRLNDVIAYKRKRDRERAEALTELTTLSEQYGGYDELQST